MEIFLFIGALVLRSVDLRSAELPLPGPHQEPESGSDRQGPIPPERDVTGSRRPQPPACICSRAASVRRLKRARQSPCVTTDALSIAATWESLLAPAAYTSC